LTAEEHWIDHQFEGYFDFDHPDWDEEPGSREEDWRHFWEQDD
jgi:hypothetical protein